MPHSADRQYRPGGRFAEASLLVEDLPDGCELNSLSVYVDGAASTICAVGPFNGFSRIDILLPSGVRTGLVPVRIEFQESVLAEAQLRVVPAFPPVPRLVSICDAVNMMSWDRIASGWMKATIEGATSFDSFRATVDGIAAEDVGVFETDSRAARFEVNFRLPSAAGLGGHILEIHMGRRLLTRMGIEIV